MDSSITSDEGFDALFPLTKRIKIPTKTGNAVLEEISIFLQSLYQIMKANLINKNKMSEKMYSIYTIHQSIAFKIL